MARLYNQLTNEQRDHITNIIIKNNMDAVASKLLLQTTLYEYQMEGIIN